MNMNMNMKIIGMLVCCLYLPVSAFAAECVDPDGDGWGWNGTSSCLPSETSQNNNVSTFCDDPDGDGWGWDGSASCLANQNSVSSAQSSNIQSNSSDSSQCLDPDGDGYGWNQSEGVTCNPNSVSNTQTSNTQSSSNNNCQGRTCTAQSPALVSNQNNETSTQNNNSTPTYRSDVVAAFEADPQFATIKNLWDKNQDSFKILLTSSFEHGLNEWFPMFNGKAKDGIFIYFYGEDENQVNVLIDFAVNNGDLPIEVRDLSFDIPALLPEQTDQTFQLATDERFVVANTTDPVRLEAYENYISDFLTLDPNANATLNQIFNTNGPIIIRNDREFAVGMSPRGQYVVMLSDSITGRYNVANTSDFAPFTVGSAAFHELTHVTTQYQAGISNPEQYSAVDGNINALLAIEQTAVNRTNQYYRTAYREPFRGDYGKTYDPTRMHSSAIPDHEAYILGQKQTIEPGFMHEFANSTIYLEFGNGSTLTIPPTFSFGFLDFNYFTGQGFN